MYCFAPSLPPKTPCCRARRLTLLTPLSHPWSLKRATALIQSSLTCRLRSQPCPLGISPRIPESCCSHSKSTWMTLNWCVWLHNSTKPELDWFSVLHRLWTTLSILCLCKPREYPKVAAVFPNRLGWLWTVVSGCATPQYPSRIDLCPSSTLMTLSILFFANPENTWELLQFFQIDLDNSPLVVFGGATSVNSNWKEVFKN